MQASQDTILVIDDSQTQLDMISFYLDECGYAVMTAKSGMEGIRTAGKQKPDIILLDINMPEMDGYETCGTIKNDRDLALIPIIFISSHSEMAGIVRGFEAGAVDYIVKPIRKEELLARVKTHLTIKRLQEHLLTTLEEKRLLINILSHDISGHLTAIIGSGEIALARSRELRDRDLEDTIEPIISAGKSITDLMQHIRMMETLDTGKASLSLEPIRVEEIIAYMLKQHRDQLEAKNLRVTCDPPLEQITTRVIADWISVTNSVFGNIITNAVKFSFRGSGISLSVREKDDMVEIVLKDEGIGIPRDILENIVNPGYPTSRPGTEGEAGSGFGMPIVNKCMKSYGGSFGITSASIDDNGSDHGTAVTLAFRKA